MTKPLDPTRNTLTFEEKKFNTQYAHLGINVVPPSDIFAQGFYDYDKREEELKTLSLEHQALVAAANKKDMCIMANGFIFAPPVRENGLKLQIVDMLRNLIDFAKKG